MKEKLAKFRKEIWRHYRSEGRHDLPWRKTRDPYRILVSEVMLQQTQVDRVRPYYTEWVARFPDAKSLARAPLGDALRLWQGLGYNRRAKMLHEAAKEIAAAGFPSSVEALMHLPGVGPYTARAVAAFAWNEDVVLVETNLRTAILHHFFPRKRRVTDEEILQVLARAHPKGRSREWHAALMDYGAHLKRQGLRTNAKVRGYRTQAPLRGSTREARGALLKELAKGPRRKARLLGLLGDDRRPQVEEQLAVLLAERLVVRSGGSYALPS